MGRFADAEQQYARAVELDPACADAHYNWSVSRAKQGDYGGAVRQCKQGLRANPDGFELLAQQAFCLRQMGAYDAALLYDEHTWGKDYPTGPAQNWAWNEKSHYAYRAAGLAQSVLSGSLDRIAHSIRLEEKQRHVVVFNPLAFEDFPDGI